MKKILLTVFICMTFLFLFEMNVKAEPEDDSNDTAETCTVEGTSTEGVYVTVSEEKLCVPKDAALYCKDSNCFMVSKTNALTHQDSGTVKLPTSIDNAYLTTIIGDSVLNEGNEDKWWSSLYSCVEVDFPENIFDSLYRFLLLWGSTNIGVDIKNPMVDTEYQFFTDSLASYMKEGANITGNIYGSDITACDTYKVIGVSPDKQISSCSKIITREGIIQGYISDYNSNHNSKSVTEYKKVKEEVKSLCKQSLEYANYNDACVLRCLTISNDIEEWDKQFDLKNGGEYCGFSEKLIAWILNIIKWIKYIVPVIVIVFGILDFIKATSSDKDDDMKKAQSNFVKRLIAAALIFLIPFIIEFILPRFGFNYNGCGIFD